MPHEFRLPDIGEGLTDAEIIEWHVAVGDAVAVDQLIVEIETAKTSVEITSTHAGAVLTLGGSPGDTVNVGDVLFVIGSAADEEPPPSFAPTRIPEVQRRAPRPMDDDADDQPAQLGASGSRPRAMPIVRKLARETGVDIALIQGSGPNGTITRADVENAATEPPLDVLTPLSRTRKAIALHMTESWTTIPHVTVQADIRAESLMAARKQRTPKPLPVEALVAESVIPLLRTYREFNGRLDGDAVAYRDHYHLGFAVDTPKGLLVVVVRDADTMTTQELATDVERLGGAALDGTLTPDEATGQTFTISNIGALGGGHGTPIIPMGTSAILSIGRANTRPVVEDGALAVGLVAPIDLSYDHRLIDGGLGQRFLADLITRLEGF